MRGAGLLIMALLLSGCTALHEPPASEDLQWSVVVYNRTQSPVFVLFHEVGACASATMPAKDLMPEGAAPTAPPGVSSLPGSLQITTPRGFAGTVSVVVTAGGQHSVRLGDLAPSALPACAGSV